MNCALIRIGCQQALRCWQKICLACVGLVFGASLEGAPAPIESVRINLQTYRNVVVQNRTATHVFFSHDRGFTSVKLIDLPQEAQIQLGLIAPPPPPPPGASAAEVATNAGAKVGAPAALLSKSREMVPELWDKALAYREPFQEKVLPVLQRLLVWVVVFLALGHLFFSFCAMLICQKAGAPGGLAVWLPLFQWLPLLKAAKMSRWNFLLLLFPGINTLVFLTWCIKIARALEKSAWAGIFLFLPVTNVFALLYLAFSDGPGDEYSSVVKLDYAQSTSD